MFRLIVGDLNVFPNQLCFNFHVFQSPDIDVLLVTIAVFDPLENPFVMDQIKVVELVNIYSKNFVYKNNINTVHF